MSRYLFWLLLLLPWLLFYFSTFVLNDTAHPLVFIINILVLNVYIINVRRKHVGLSLQATIKAIIPGIGYKEWQRLYFAKP